MKKLLPVFMAMVYLFTACDKSSNPASNSASGNSTGGSMARFTLVGHYLYTVSQHQLKTFDVSDPANPRQRSTISIGPDIETIFPFKGNLYIGSNTAVYLYTLADPAKPQLSSTASYFIRGNDPVVANDSLAYSTIRNFGLNSSTLNVIRVTDPKALNILNRINVNTALYGLGMADSALYVCQHLDGLQVYSIRDSLAYAPATRRLINDGETYYDVIPAGNRLYTWIDGGNSIFDITDRMKPVLLSKTKN